MTHPCHPALSTVKKWGGTVEDYLGTCKTIGWTGTHEWLASAMYREDFDA
ncbi:hypothetical protein [Marinovum sp.]|nr:hypothetical protein [Marinovum sp.]